MLYLGTGWVRRYSGAMQCNAMQCDAMQSDAMRTHFTYRWWQQSAIASAATGCPLPAIIDDVVSVSVGDGGQCHLAEAAVLLAAAGAASGSSRSWVCEATAGEAMALPLRVAST